MLFPHRLLGRACWTAAAVPRASSATCRSLHRIHGQRLAGTLNHSFESLDGQRRSLHNGLSGSLKNQGPVPEFQARTVLEGSTTAGKQVTVSSGDGFIQVEDKDRGGWTRLDSTVLRDSCTCLTCTDPASGQKRFATTDIPLDIEIAQIQLTEQGLGIKFRNDIPRLSSPEHQTLLPWTAIEQSLGHRSMPKPTRPPEDAIYPKTGRTFWEAHTIQSRVRKIDYHEFMKGEAAFWQTLLDLGNLGLVFLKNVPHDEASIVAITTRIANIKETFYGRTFDVRAKPAAENVAYTSGYLGLHQDLLYLSRPPAIQLLHCLENSCAGGESLFSDALRVGRLLWLQRHEHPLAVDPLRAVRVPYHYAKHGYLYGQARPLFDVTADGQLANVFWSPPFQDRFPAATADLRGWLGPARLFERLINADAAMYRYKMQPGECVLFDNLRVMHGRTAFDVGGGGSRWLRGAYIEREDYVSRVLHVPDELAGPYRGGEWHREAEEASLRESQGFGHVKSELDKVAHHLQQKGVQMTKTDIQVLNGEMHGE